VSTTCNATARSLCAAAMLDGSERLYVIVRTDLTPGRQAAQLGHAVALFALAHPRELSAWGNRTIAVLGVDNERHLDRVRADLGIDGAEVSAVVQEPDYTPGRIERTAFVALPGAPPAAYHALRKLSPILAP
jgi:hypothetical protein